MNERFHLTLSASGRPAMHGWWAREATARDKFTRWGGRDVDEARIVLVDEATGTTLDEWPRGVGGQP